MKKIIKYISKQFGKPTGFGGVLSTFVMNCLNRKMYKVTEKKLTITENDVILDIGFGNGYMLKRIAKFNCKKLFGIEISRDMISVATKKNRTFIRNGKIELLESDVLKMPFANNSINKVYTINTVYFWNDLQKGLSEILRILQPDGSFINVIYTEKWLDKLIITKYGFTKYPVEILKNETQKYGFKDVQIIEIQKNKSLLLIGKKQNI